MTSSKDIASHDEECLLNVKSVIGTHVLFIDVDTGKERHGTLKGYHPPMVWEIKPRWPSRGKTCFAERVWAEDGRELAQVSIDNRKKK